MTKTGKAHSTEVIGTKHTDWWRSKKLPSRERETEREFADLGNKGQRGQKDHIACQFKQLFFVQRINQVPV